MDTTSPRQAKPFRSHHIIRLQQLLLRGSSTADISSLETETLRSLVALVLGHDALLRSSELLSTSSADFITNTPDSLIGPYLTISRSKTLHHGEPQQIPLPLFTKPYISAGHLLPHLIRRITRRDPTVAVSLFQASSSRPLQPQPFTHHVSSKSRRWLQSCLAKAATLNGLQPDYFTSHSLRSGGATDLFASSLDPATIQFHGRWKSSVFLRYNRLSLAERVAAVTKAFTTITEPSSSRGGHSRYKGPAAPQQGARRRERGHAPPSSR